MIDNFDRNRDFFWMVIFICWLVATVATLGSLFFSEVMEFVPCVLCWYQRVLMYPLVIIFLVGLFPLDKKVIKFSLPLVIIGWLISLYHNLLYYGIIPENISPCSKGVSCSTVYIKWFGFISIPLLALASFTILLILLITLHRRVYR